MMLRRTFLLSAFAFTAAPAIAGARGQTYPSFRAALDLPEFDSLPDDVEVFRTFGGWSTDDAWACQMGRHSNRAPFLTVTQARRIGCAWRRTADHRGPLVSSTYRKYRARLVERLELEAWRNRPGVRSDNDRLSDEMAGVCTDGVITVFECTVPDGPPGFRRTSGVSNCESGSLYADSATMLGRIAQAQTDIGSLIPRSHITDYWSDECEGPYSLDS